MTMSQVVVNGAMMMCTMGVAPMSLTVIPKGPPVEAGSQLVATISDNIPMANIPPFGMCNSMANPAVAAATAAKLGVFTPGPCLPVIPAPWAPGSPTVMVGGTPALTSDSTCMCAWAGQISITQPGQMTVETG
jgi:hypothetical protein